MSPLRAHDRLDALAIEIRRLRGAVLEHERTALDGGDDRAIETAANARALLDAALHEHFELADQLRTASCPIHGAATCLGCPTCARAARSRRPALEHRAPTS